ncbi:MAG: ABC transporter permease subunit [Chloroflexi bacterium]|nr:ABC transporter permease subunit [Chloroflexota bacterium]
MLVRPDVVARYDPYAVDLSQQLLPSSSAHWLGTDQFGRDEWTRLVYGARTTLGAALLVLLLTLVVSGVMAVATTLPSAGARRPSLLLVNMCLALPTQVVAIAVIGLLGPGLSNAMVAVIATGWAAPAWLLRGLLVTEVNATHVEAARALGARESRVLVRHVGPAIAGRAAIVVSLAFGQFMLTLSALSYLGLGAQPPTAEWGAMLNDAQPFFLTTPLLLVWPAAAIMVCVALSGLLAERV